MTSVLIAVTAATHWTLADGSTYPCGFWPEELIDAHRLFAEAGYRITLATPGGVTPTPDPAGLIEEAAAYLSALGTELTRPHVLEHQQTDSYDLLYVPGGHGPMEDLAVNAELGALVRELHLSGKPVSAVCHGTAAVLRAQDDTGDWLFRGFECTGFTTEGERDFDLELRAPWLLEGRIADLGGHYTRARDPWGAHVVVDRGLYTGQNPASTEPLVKRLIADLNGTWTA
ncbi:type 1 glutamine amidotransferase domain-containing protein [Streptomyces sp. NBC_00237]|uniref:type 1 glutamine amidotransferase domain-containing protein n=1 Tax=Streptomyces sp. NBC_00237 TaxID=2975687 RepID=UPI0022512B72|nr:type 1 glutamine amidotransferase domain-containing protein [Streptomyces sp. NBC_00237]MCX5205981.1 type 1 glutamine amidotransferase domain-containing protein [Streptomyces sp. NBC_00237]